MYFLFIFYYLFYLLTMFIVMHQPTKAFFLYVSIYWATNLILPVDILVILPAFGDCLFSARICEKHTAGYQLLYLFSVSKLFHVS